MSALLSLSIKGKDGKYKNYTISISDTTNDFGQNVVMYEQQTKDEVAAKAKKKYIGNGKCFWTDGKIVIAEKKEQTKQTVPQDASFVDEQDESLPF